MSIIVNILLLLLTCFIFIFTLNQSRTTDDFEAHSCSYPDNTNCQQYYNCFGNLVSCSVENRYDINSNSCRSYYLTDCGERYNPPMPQAHVLCLPYQQNLSSKDLFPLPYCNRFIQCFASNFHLSYCTPTDLHFSIENETCMHRDDVDCGSRRY